MSCEAVVILHGVRLTGVMFEAAGKDLAGFDAGFKGVEFDMFVSRGALPSKLSSLDSL